MSHLSNDDPRTGSAFCAGARVRLKSNPGRSGVLSAESLERKGVKRWQVHFQDGSEFVPELALEVMDSESSNPYLMIRALQFGKPRELRAALTYFRLSGRLADLIYSLNTTNTEFLAYQFKPVLSILDSPSGGLLIADEVGLGKTIEAGLIWTELRSRIDARRLLVVCPAMLREKWRRELADRFAVEAEICNADELLSRLEDIKAGRRRSFALIGSLQGLRPPAGWSDDEGGEKSATARLARFLSEGADYDPLFDLVVIDEAHYLRNPETQTAKFGRLLRPVADNLILLSATPIQLRSRDLFQLLNLLDEDSFPYEWSFETVLEENAPLVALRDRLLKGPLSSEDFSLALQAAGSARTLTKSETLRALAAAPPTTIELSDAGHRTLLAERLDRMNPLVKAVNRTRKRDVHERRVVRQPYALRTPMSAVERRFYEEVTARVRNHCESMDIAQGFMLTVPQRQMCSSMAAACRSWQRRIEDAEIEELVWETFGDDASEAAKPTITPLIAELARTASEAGDYQSLRDHDSKFRILWDQLSEYWKRFPNKKVVLFSYFRETLHYLNERFDELGVPSAVVMGGMDKDAILDDFRSPGGPRILLSSEVASEGVDLQFSSLVVNYDLPWNPMRIEQRIGRIDRIGQSADVILIWNLLYEDTLDDRVYTRLFERLGIFEKALGSTEAMLGTEIRTMSYELLRHHLTPEQEAEVIEQARTAVETNNRLEERLEDEAIQLVAHGDYIQQKISIARELKRFVTNEDLLSYFRDFFDQYYPGSQVVVRNDAEMLCEVELAAGARLDLAEFLRAEKLEGRTRLAVPGAGRVLAQFDNRLGRPRLDREIVSQYHPVIAFIGARLRVDEVRRNAPVSALEVGRYEVGGVKPGEYVFVVERWALSGGREIEKLMFAARPFRGSGAGLGRHDAERLVNTAAVVGREWLNGRGVLEGDAVEELLHQCVDELETGYGEFVEEMARESRDRINLQLEILARYEDRKRGELNARIEILRQRGHARVIPAIQGQLRRLSERSGDRKALLERRLETTHEHRLVAVGVINVF